eukprot:CAMPEP_0198123248 /NCGR_PEP_ID=MMETSP1442-20131203/37086_1 /TAXON_ID= /ORGANISM="Craspedostauros australis, Strain CCMP3328" /LENGTH=36 /DNA_ID= /DNA_START= /DNA_END= /DNA_ORIENTATION=
MLGQVDTTVRNMMNELCHTAIPTNTMVTFASSGSDW